MAAFIAQVSGSAFKQARASRVGAERFRIYVQGHCMMGYTVYDPPDLSVHKKAVPGAQLFRM